MPTKPQIERREKVLIYLQEHSEGATARQVSEALGIHYTTANDDLNMLHFQHKVSSEGGPALRTPRTWKAAT